MRPWYKNLDWTVLAAWVGLVSIGLTAIYSATHGPAREFLLLSVQQNFDRQLQWFVISAFVLTVILFTPARLIQRLALPAYAGGIALLLGALAFGTEVNGAKAWLYLGPIGLQPGEIAKVGTVLALAFLLSTKEARTGGFRFVLLAGGVVFLPAALLLAANDTGTALVFLALVPVMLFWSGLVPLTWMALMLAPAVAAYLAIVSLTAALVFAVAFTAAMLMLARSQAMAGLALGVSGGTGIAAWLGLNKILQPHQVGRIKAFVDPEAYRLTEGFHVIQAKAAIGSGGFLGKGFTNGTQTQLAYIPEQSTDFIFCVIGEEFGFVGAMVLLSLFAWLLIRLASVGAAAAFSFPRLVAAGVTGVFLFHILINIGMTVGLMPVIGIPLPLISYGGSALLANTMLIAITLNLAARRDEFAVYSG
ncbi:MAG TPA: rod shape-determining protein RodA [Rubricoccaceae bacterium]|nr:rod shape-determining protein RodA [Rubricoccaceae bacterium]